MADTRISHVDVGGLSLSVTMNGPENSDRPAVVLLHGFPEIGYSWRHQIKPLADAGWRVLAPDQRGYGWSDAPDDLDDYRIDQLVGDVIGLLDAQGCERAVIVGHDWGALVAPWVAHMRPDRVAGVALLSVPYLPRTDQSPIERLRATDPDGPFGYILAFQGAGIEALFDADPIETLRSFHWSVCGARPDDLEPGGAVPAGLPPYLSQGEIENYYRAFARSGFGNPINWYRNMHRNWELTRPWNNATLDVPTLFIGGDRDFVVTASAGSLGHGVEDMAATCTDLRGVHVIPGAGHWIQQEAPDQVTELLLTFLNEVAA